MKVIELDGPEAAAVMQDGRALCYKTLAIAGDDAMSLAAMGDAALDAVGERIKAAASLHGNAAIVMWRKRPSIAHRDFGGGGYTWRCRLATWPVISFEGITGYRQEGAPVARVDSPTGPKKYRKKPVVIEAFTFDEMVAFGKAQSGANIVGGVPWSFLVNGFAITHETNDCYLISTLEGDMKMRRGDMLVIGVKGEIYPRKPDIFAETYEPVAPGTGGGFAMPEKGQN